SSGLCDHAQALVAARYTARRVKRRCQKLIAWRMMMTVEESRSVVGAAPASPRHICRPPSRRYSQRSRVDRHLAKALARGGVDSIGDCGDNGRSSSFAHAARLLGAIDDVHFDCRRVIDPQHLVSVEIGLLDPSVFEGDFAVKCRCDAKDDRALDLGANG